MKYIFDIDSIEDIDLLSMQHLQDEGYIYLIESYNKINDIYTKNMSINTTDLVYIEQYLSNITKLYICNDELFNNSLELFCDDIFCGKFELLKNMVKYNYDNDTIELICNKICNMNKSPDKGHIYLELLEIFSNENIIKNLTNGNVFELLMTYLKLLQITLDTESYDKYIKPLHIHLIPYLKNKKLKAYLITKLSEKVYSFKHYNPLKVDYNELQNILVFAYCLFNTGSNEKNLSLINASYPHNTGCCIDWFNKTDESNIEFNLITESFYIFLYAINTLYTPLVDIYKDVQKTLGDFELEAERLITSMSSQFAQQLLEKIYSKMKTIRDVGKKITNIIDNPFFQGNLNSFSSTLSGIILKTKSSTWDDILTDLLSHINRQLKNKLISIDDNMAILIVRVVGTKLYTLNPHIRSKFLKMAVTIDPYNTEYNNNILEGVINFYNDIGLSKADGMELEKVTTSMLVYNYILTKCFGKDFKPTNRFYQLTEVAKKNELKFKMFMNFIVNDMSKIIDILYKIIGDYSELDDDYHMQTDMGSIVAFLKYCSETIQILDLFITNSEHFRLLLSCDEVLIAFRSSIITVIYKYVEFINDEEKQEKLKKIYEYTLSPINFYELVRNTLVLISRFENDDKVQSRLFCQSDSINLDKLIIFSDLINTNTNTNISDQVTYNTIQNIVSKIKTHNDNENSTNTEIEYPDEFLDELLCIPLENPVILPGTKQIVNRNTILQYIMTDQLNPYDKQPLTVASLDEFNDTPEIKATITELMDKFSKWKANKK